MPKKVKRLSLRAQRVLTLDNDTLKFANEQLAEQVRQLNHSIAAKALEIREADARLLEARRRTIPFGHEDALETINFLPLYVERLDYQMETVDIGSANGFVTRHPSLMRGTMLVHVAMVPNHQKPVEAKRG